MLGSNAESGVGFCAARGVEDEGGLKTVVGREVEMGRDDVCWLDVVCVIVVDSWGVEVSFVRSDNCVVVVTVPSEAEGDFSAIVKYCSISFFASVIVFVVGIKLNFNKTFPSLNPNCANVFCSSSIVVYLHSMIHITGKS